ncbi:hypothetical protein [Sandaracinobacter sp.]|uniref:hypothetical protein n=1 Tax=Sandaracinobacter sp. TaxID=2487581 RepID=UPI0035B262A4
MSLAAAVFTPLLVTHVAAGAVALVSGLIAMASRKGAGGLHAKAGNAFCLSMSAMAVSAAILTAWEPDRLSLGAAIWTFYLVHSSRQAAQMRGATSRRPPWQLMAIGLAATLLIAHGAMMANRAPDGAFEGSGTAGYLAFGSAAAVSLLLDLSLLLRAPLSARHRLARHLWRMLAACFLAVTSLFLGQQDDVFPFMAGSPVLLAPSLLTLGALIFWLLRVHLARNWLGQRPAGRTGHNSPQPQKAST